MTDLQDWNPGFPTWKRLNLAHRSQGMDKIGLDLLEVRRLVAAAVVVVVVPACFNCNRCWPRSPGGGHCCLGRGVVPSHTVPV